MYICFYVFDYHESFSANVFRACMRIAFKNNLPVRVAERSVNLTTSCDGSQIKKCQRLHFDCLLFC